MLRLPTSTDVNSESERLAKPSWLSSRLSFPQLEVIWIAEDTKGLEEGKVGRRNEVQRRDRVEGDGKAKGKGEMGRGGDIERGRGRVGSCAEGR